MDLKHHDSQPEKKLSNQLAEFVDLTDEDLEEVTVLEAGGTINGVQGSRCGGCGHGCGGGFGHGCGGCGGCGRCGFGHGCGCGRCGRCGFGRRCGGCGRCGFGHGCGRCGGCGRW